jgi:hypothetical protein
MVSRLHSRLDRIEQQSAPLLERVRERREKLESVRASILRNGYFEMAHDALRYIGRDASRAQTEQDLTEIMLLSIAEHHSRYGRWFKGLPEVERAMACALVALMREWYGREMTEDEARRELEFSTQVENDMLAGLPVERSEAAQYFINLYAQYPRLKFSSDRHSAYMAGVEDLAPYGPRVNL